MGEHYQIQEMVTRIQVKTVAHIAIGEEGMEFGGIVGLAIGGPVGALAGVALGLAIGTLGSMAFDGAYDWFKRRKW